VAEILGESGRQWSARPPANERAIEHLKKIAPPGLPIEYVDLLRYSNGGEGPIALPSLYFMLYDATYAAKVNASAEQRDLYPGHFVIGSNGGLETIAFDTCNECPWPVVMYDGVAGVDSAVVIARDMSTFVRAIGLDFQQDT